MPGIRTSLPTVASDGNRCRCESASPRRTVGAVHIRVIGPQSTTDAIVPAQSRGTGHRARGTVYVGLAGSKWPLGTSSKPKVRCVRAFPATAEPRRNRPSTGKCQLPDHLLRMPGSCHHNAHHQCYARRPHTPHVLFYFTDNNKGHRNRGRRGLPSRAERRSSILLRSDVLGSAPSQHTNTAAFTAG